ncbi:MAG: cell adhesion domain-containing protein [Clostridia bacterium]|nr:cell adhesion domain-containing protein [Clostridia bacterium]
MFKKGIGVLIIMALFISCVSFAGAVYDGQSLDYGIYWFGLGNVSQKHTSGVTNPYYDPNKPTIIYVHGWQNGATPELRRETFNYKKNDSTYGVDVNTADAWIKAGWNIGIFYWTQFADEASVTDAEAKIWSATGPKGMRWRKIDGTYVTTGVTKNAAELFYDSYVQALSDYTGSNVRITGHSLGNQMAVHLTKLVSDKVSAGQLPKNLLPKRVALLDPFWSKYGKDYLGGKWTGEKVREFVAELKTKGVLFEQYRSSAVELGGDSNTELQKMTAFSELAPWYIPTLEITWKHVAAYNWYFYSFYSNPPIECTINFWGTRIKTGNVAANAKTSDSRIAEMMSSSYRWVQVEGRYTADPADDWFERKSR